MRTLRLARIAAEAEGLRLRRQAQRLVTRAVLGLVSLGFLIAALVCGHLAVWFWLRKGIGWAAAGAGATLAGGDLVLAGCLALIATHSEPGRVETEALHVRQQALDRISRGYALSALVIPALQLLLERQWRGKR